MSRKIQLWNSMVIFVFFVYFAPQSSRVMSSALSDSPVMSSAFYETSQGQCLSKSNSSVSSASLLSCVVVGLADASCVVVNFLHRHRICQLIYSHEKADERAGFFLEASLSWISVNIRETCLSRIETTSPGPQGDSPDVSSTTPSPEGCPQGALGEFEGSCYKLFREEVAMFVAVSRCQTEGGQLVAINGDREQAHLCSLLTDLEIWTGGTFDKGVPYWTSTGQNMGYTNWIDGVFPGSTSGTAVYMDSSKVGCPWVTQSFTTLKPFLCEYTK